MNTGLLDHGRQRLSNRAPRLKKRAEVGAGAQARDAQLEAAGARLPATYTSTGRDSRCAAPGARCSSRHSPRRSWRRPPAPSVVRPQSRSSRGADRHRHSIPPAREAPSWAWPSGVILGSAWLSQPDPDRETRRPPPPQPRNGDVTTSCQSGFLAAPLHQQEPLAVFRCLQRVA